MASRVLVSGLPRSLPPLPPGPAPTCVPCVEGRQRAAPHSSEFPPTEAPLQTLHMDVWGPARVRGQGHERYFLLVVDDYSRYTTVFPLRRKDEVTEVLIDWIRAARLQLRKSFGSDFPVLRLHSDRGGEFSSGPLRAFCHARGIRQTFTLPASPQQNGIAKRRIGMVMDVARTSMIHAAAPHFLWPFAVQYAAHQINLQPRVSMPDTSPTLRWTGQVGDASAFRVWGSLDFVRDLSTNKLSSRAVPCVFLGFPPDAPGWQFYHPTSRRVLSSQDVTFDESVPYYRLFPYRAVPLPPPPLFLTPGPPPVDPLPPQGPAPSGVSQVDPPPLAEPLEVTSDTSGSPEGGDVAADAPAAYRLAPRLETPPGFPPRPSSPPLQPVTVGSRAVGGGAPGGAASCGAESGGAKPAREELGGPTPVGAVSGGTEPVCAESGGAESGGETLEGTGTAGARPTWSGRLRPRVPLTTQQLHDWYGRRQGRAAGARGSAAGGTGAAGAGGAAPGGAAVGDAAVGDPGTGGAGSGGATAGDTAVGDPGTGGAGSGGAAAGDTAVGDPGTAGAGSGGAAAGDAGSGAAGAGGTGSEAGASGAAGGTGAAGGAGGSGAAAAVRAAGAAGADR
ncbi:unnamed protein product [Closterium sp. Yama58-4]|nr:unnamed protein product [Closterium sp. Yama58-4]